ncbi:MAG: hypothetical protein V3S69_02565 [Dehalococcoidales bacterium]
MQLDHGYFIDGRQVEKVASFHGVDVYNASGDVSETLYFVKKDEIVQTLHITADCNQNTGYVDGLEFGTGN